MAPTGCTVAPEKKISLSCKGKQTFQLTNYGRVAGKDAFLQPRIVLIAHFIAFNDVCGVNESKWVSKW